MGVVERKEREKEYRKMQILEAGEKLFLKKGFENITMDEIAKECELSKGTLYLYFRSKEELFYTLVLKGMNILIDMFREGISKSNTFQEKMNSLGVQYLKFYKDYPTYYKMVNYMGDHRSLKREGVAELEKLLIQKNNEIWKINVELFEEGIRRGIFKNNFNPLEFAIMVWASSNGMIQLLDHIKSNSGNVPEHELEEHPICCANIEKMLNDLWERLFISIMVNPEDELRKSLFNIEG